MTRSQIEVCLSHEIIRHEKERIKLYKKLIKEELKITNIWEQKPKKTNNVLRELRKNYK